MEKTVKNIPISSYIYILWETSFTNHIENSIQKLYKEIFDKIHRNTFNFFNNVQIN